MYSRLDTQARIALMQAADEARDLGHPTVGPEHLLLGLLADRRSEAASLLLAHGLTFDGCREAVVSHHRDHPEAAPAPDDDREDDPARAYAEDREALAALGIDLDRIREAVRSSFGEDLAEEWGGRSRRRRGRSRGGRHHHRSHGHGRGHGRGRRGPRGGGPFGLPFRDSLKDVLRDTMRALAVDRARDQVDERLEGRRPRRGPQRLEVQHLVLALLDNPDPAVGAALAGLDADAVRRELGTQPA
jgi:hypothetical protein